MCVVTVCYDAQSRPQNWPETTDPHKFVYEDIAIATYLLVSLRVSPCMFVSLSCPCSYCVCCLKPSLSASLAGGKRHLEAETEAVFC